MSFKINIPKSARMLIGIIEDTGHAAYIVGGCVRDSLLGKTPHDWDICTSSKPEQVITALEQHNIRVVDTGLKHGTVTAVMDDGNYEITTFRVDGVYSDGRHPDRVEFVNDITADLGRRDFTINAMAYNDSVGLIDPYGGVGDLEGRVIRCVGDPDERFTEDALRILRAMRFASTYGFSFDFTTFAHMYRKRRRLNDISAERIRDELCKMLLGGEVSCVLFSCFEIICQIIPELEACVDFDQNNRFHEFDIYEHIAHSVCNYEGGDISIKVALLLHDIGKPICYTEDERGGHFYGHPAVSHDMAKDILTRLKFDNITRDEILDLILHHDAEIKASKRVARRLLNKLGTDRVMQLVEVKRADILAHSEIGRAERLTTLQEFEKIVAEVIAEGECFKIKDLSVNGHDICSFGVSGPTVGRVLNHLLNMVIEETLENNHDSLMTEAKEFLSGGNEHG